MPFSVGSYNSEMVNTVNIVCLGFSHECSEFSQSSYFLEFRVKNVIKYLEFFMY